MSHSFIFDAHHANCRFFGISLNSSVQLCLDHIDCWKTCPTDNISFICSFFLSSVSSSLNFDANNYCLTRPPIIMSLTVNTLSSENKWQETNVCGHSTLVHRGFSQLVQSPYIGHKNALTDDVYDTKDCKEQVAGCHYALLQKKLTSTKAWSWVVFNWMRELKQMSPIPKRKCSKIIPT